MRIACCVAFILIVGAIASVGQSPDNAAGLSTYTTPDGTFQFQYPDNFVTCRQDTKQGDLWLPTDVCDSYIPLCSTSEGNESGMLVCLGYPAQPGEQSTTFLGAAFTVADIGKVAQEDLCYRISETTPAIGQWQTHTINGLQFHVIQTDGAASLKYREGHVYRVVHRGTCYELNVTIVSFSGQATDPPTKEFDRTPIRKALTTAVDTFKFLR